MLELSSLLTFIPAAALIILLPGPATLLVAGLAGRSRRAAVSATWGIVAGDTLLIVASGAGVTTLLTQWPVLLMGIRMAGAVYLLYLGWGLLRQQPSVMPASSQELGARSHFWQGLLLTLGNPKPILFFAAFFPLFLTRQRGSVWWSYAQLGAVFELLNVLYFFTLILACHRLAGWGGPKPQVTRWLPRLSGGCLITCAVMVLTQGVGTASG
ncbi:LysE family translocator [Leeia aquatica]|uniref:LysE family translocator n=1 Tax=Leeia aquatica TaxID=2725557 RepID=A0A847SJC0_9NEIS|nr:LysE family translocator [Leeia aquatica]NLR76002.1 LysE family translocator [Leeia aquatica]